MKTILTIRKRGEEFKVFEEMRIEERFEDFSNSGSQSNWAIVSRIRTVTLLRYRLNKRILPRSRIVFGCDDERDDKPLEIARKQIPLRILLRYHQDHVSY